MVEKEVEIVRLIEWNKDLKNRLDINNVMVEDKINWYDKIFKYVYVFVEYFDNLGEEVEKLKEVMDCRFEKFEEVNRDIGWLVEG